jgi:phosphonate transport system substrate-binding protein
MIAPMRYAIAAAVLAAFSLCCCRGNDSLSTVIRFSVLPDWNKGQLAQDSQTLADYLSEQLGVKVVYVASNDYTACVNALAANKIDFVWLGGKTTCDAIDVGAGAVHVLATRDIDLHFKSYFIGNHKTVGSGELSVTGDLSSWRGKTQALRFTFGDINSTSGHLMPRHFLNLVGIDPDQDFLSVGTSGSHSATLQSVANGTVDCGALNYAYYDAASDELKNKAVLLYTTPEYVDYAWVAHDRIGAELIAGLRQALVGLNADKEREKRILDAWKAGSFQPAKDEQWDAIRQVRDSLPKGFLK